jgi:glycosyltransferase involved in cell wall biosynthesis
MSRRQRPDSNASTPTVARTLLAETRDRLRIVLYSDAIDVGGAEIGARYLLQHLDRRVEVTVVGTEKEVVAKIAEGRAGTTKVLLPPIRDQRDLAALRTHLRTLRQLRPDIVQVNLQVPWASRYATLAAFLTPGAKTVAVEHLPLAPSSPTQARTKQWLSRRLSAHVAVGHRSARELEDRWQLRPESIRSIHNGVPDRPIEPSTASHGEFVVGSVGRLHEQKGYDVLLEAAAGVPGSTVVLVGTGPQSGALQALARRCGLGDRVIFLGWLDDPLPKVATFDVLVLPSRWEAFPLSILEAMLAGVAVIATDVGSVREAVIDGETGLLVQPDDAAELARALRALRDDPELRRRLAESGREFARRNFTATAMARSYEALYDEISS